MTTAHEDLIEGYLATWNEPDAGNRTALAKRVFTEQARYCDPLLVAEDRATIVASVGAVQQQFPGWTFRRLGPVDAHHNVARFRWTLSPDGTDDADTAPVVGFDVAVIDDAGRISAVHGFLDKVPTA